MAEAIVHLSGAIDENGAAIHPDVILPPSSARTLDIAPWIDDSSVCTSFPTCHSLLTLPPSSLHHLIDLLALAFPQNLPYLSSLFVKALPPPPLVLQTSAYSNLIHFSTNHTTPMVLVNQNHPYLASAVSRVDHQSLACVQIPPLRLRSLYLRCPTTARPHLSPELLSPPRIRPFTWVRKRRRKRRSSWPRSFAQLLPLPNLSNIPKKNPTNLNWTLI